MTTAGCYDDLTAGSTSAVRKSRLAIGSFTSCSAIYDSYVKYDGYPRRFTLNPSRVLFAFPFISGTLHLRNPKVSGGTFFAIEHA